MLVLPDFLDKTAKADFESYMHDGHSSGCYNRTYPEVVQYFLKLYGKRRYLEAALHEFTSCKQNSDETEVVYGRRLQQAAQQCGNVFKENELITQFLSGVRTAVRASLAKLHKNSPFKRLQEAIDAAADAGDLHREMMKTLAPKSAVSSRTTERVSRAPFRPSGRRATGVMPVGNVQAKDAASHSHPTQLEEADAQTGTDTVYQYQLSTPPSTVEGEPVLHAALSAVMHLASPVPAAPARTAPIDVCYKCFAMGHRSLNCTLPPVPIGDQQQELKNGLTIHGNWSRLPDTLQQRLLKTGPTPFTQAARSGPRPTGTRTSPEGCPPRRGAGCRKRGKRPRSARLR